jgi:hypothetical protein
MNKLGLQCTYTWKCHKETPCIAILNKQKCHFFSFTKLKNRRAEQVLPQGVGSSHPAKQFKKKKRKEANLSTNKKNK